MANPRKKTVSITYNGVDATRDLEPCLKSVTYTDSMDESDSITLVLDDRNKDWSNRWFPANGDKVAASFTLDGWLEENNRQTLACGEFVVDDFTITGPDMECRLNGVSAPVASDFKETKRTKTWEVVTVRGICQEIAGRYGMELAYDTAADITIERQEQDGKPDSSFLKEICSKYGLGIKIYSSRLVVWNYREYDQKPSELMIAPDLVVGRWSYKSSIQGTYTGARLTYTDASKKDGIEVMVGTDGRVLAVNEKAENEADARRIGENAIWEANRKEITMSLGLRPDRIAWSTKNAQVSGFGRLDGKYRIEKVVHSLSRKDYTKQLSLSRIE